MVSCQCDTNNATYFAETLHLHTMSIEEGTGKEIGGPRNANSTMDVRRYKAGLDNE